VEPCRVDRRHGFLGGLYDIRPLLLGDKGAFLWCVDTVEILIVEVSPCLCLWLSKLDVLGGLGLVEDRYAVETFSAGVFFSCCPVISIPALFCPISKI
jgi:hypothetical protein